MMNARLLKCGSLPAQLSTDMVSRLQTGLPLKALSIPSLPIASLPKRLLPRFPSGASGGASEELYRLLLLC
jgi:hypothetical protein